MTWNLTALEYKRREIPCGGKSVFLADEELRTRSGEERPGTTWPILGPPWAELNVTKKAKPNTWSDLGKLWSGGLDSNQRPLDPQRDTLGKLLRQA
jgi:hypothetical protein